MQSKTSNVSTYPLTLASINHRHNNNNSTKPHPNMATTNKTIFPVPCVKDNMAGRGRGGGRGGRGAGRRNQVRFARQQNNYQVQGVYTSHQAITLDYKDKT